MHNFSKPKYENTLVNMLLDDCSHSHNFFIFTMSEKLLDNSNLLSVSKRVLFHINYIVSHLDTGSAHLYADDTILLCNAQTKSLAIACFLQSPK